MRPYGAEILLTKMQSIGTPCESKMRHIHIHLIAYKACQELQETTALEEKS